MIGQPTKVSDNQPKWLCIVCLVPVPDYTPIFCCDGSMCGCLGLPDEPPFCSSKCSDLFYGIGKKEKL